MRLDVWHILEDSADDHGRDKIGLEETAGAGDGQQNIISAKFKRFLCWMTGVAVAEEPATGGANLIKGERSRIG